MVVHAVVFFTGALSALGALFVYWIVDEWFSSRQRLLRWHRRQ